MTDVSASQRDISQRVRGLQESLARLEERQHMWQENVSTDIGEIKEGIIVLANVERDFAQCRAIQDTRWGYHDSEHKKIDKRLEIHEELIQNSRIQLAKVAAVAALVGAAVGVIAPYILGVLF